MLLALLAAAFVVGLSKGGLASAGALAVPALAFAMNPVQAAAILLPVFIGTDWIAVWLYRRAYSPRNLAILVPAILIGVLVATVITPWTPEPVLLILTGLIGLWFVLRRWFGPVVTAPAEAGVLPGLGWGILTGITSFITHSGSPPAQAYLMPQRLPKLEFAGTMAIAFSVCNLAKLPGYWAIGALEGLDVELTLGLLVSGGIGTMIGRWLTARLPDAVYLRAIEGLLLTLSILLIAKALL
ncbi:sulfite exporter TauE/SafE family protein [Palleronia marisminoris]|uniref:sulfite exporter TauE/SafE family protein n=1 Tax=Palleronia marisminoris TaxID=315423 RepID=UPI0023EA5535|nr:sulfite exporter TauE/SafE family protein [Palleronia marisminoris]